jgi:hypothetical protein
MTFAPLHNRDGVEFFVIGSLHRMHNALAGYQVTSGSQSIVLRSKGAGHSVAIQSWIEVMRGPGHAALI